MADPRVIQAIRERARTRKRRTPRAPVAPRYPAGAELRYVRALRAYVRAVRAAVVEYVMPVLDQDGDGVANTTPVGDLNRAWARVSEAVGVELIAAQKAAGVMLAEVARDNTESMNASYKRVVGVAPFGKATTSRTDALTSIEEILRARLRANVALITSIAPTALDEVHDVINAGFRSGLRVEDLSKSILERFSVATSRAELIARDQVGKLNAQLTESRNRQVGATRYVWQVSGGPSGDGRVRDTHLALDGQTFHYDDPPVTNDQGDRNNPGTDYSCRCSAAPILEDVLDALGV